nr:unnamed protein product [Naegleria fowleri]
MTTTASSSRNHHPPNNGCNSSSEREQTLNGNLHMAPPTTMTSNGKPSSLSSSLSSSEHHHQMVVNSYHKVKELYAMSVSRYNQGKYFHALESFLECKNLVESELASQQEKQSVPSTQQSLHHQAKQSQEQHQRHDNLAVSSVTTTTLSSTQEKHQVSNSKQKNKKHKSRSNSDTKTILGKGHNESTALVGGHEERSLVKVEPSQQVTPVHIEESDNYYLYLYYQICFQLAKCHFKLGQLSKAIYYLYHQCSQCENITANQEYSTLIQEVERMIYFDKNIDANKISAEDIEKFVIEIQPIHFFSPATNNGGYSDNNSHHTAMLSSSTSTSSVGSRNDDHVVTSPSNNFSIFFSVSSPYSIHNAKHASLPSTYSTDKRNDWQSIFLKYQKSVCK